MMMPVMVESGNIRAIAGGSGVDGFLVGHASADSSQFTALVKALV
jgi:triosephosphate isomerase